MHKNWSPSWNKKSGCFPLELNHYFSWSKVLVVALSWMMEENNQSQLCKGCRKIGTGGRMLKWRRGFASLKTPFLITSGVDPALKELPPLKMQTRIQKKNESSSTKPQVRIPCVAFISSPLTTHNKTTLHSSTDPSGYTLWFWWGTWD